MRKNAESDLLLFEEREEQLNDMIDEKESNGSTNVKFLKKLKKKLEKCEEEVEKKQAVVKDCKRTLRKWGKKTRKDESSNE